MRGIRVRLHYTWAIACILITAMVMTQFPESYALWQRVLIGVAGSLLFLVAVCLRELAVAFVGSRRGIRLKRLTLFAFGGVSEIALESTAPVLDVLRATVGLLSNLVLVGVFHGLYLLADSLNWIVGAGLLRWLGFIYLMLAFLHFLPAYPLDGGRILRAVLWKRLRDYQRASWIVTRAGRGSGFALLAVGVTVLGVTHQVFVGLVLMSVGWILQSAAFSSWRTGVPARALRGLKVRDVMAHDIAAVGSHVSLEHLVREHMLVTGQRYFLVVEGDRLEGVVAFQDVKKIPRKRWANTTTTQVMTPACKVRAVTGSEPALTVWEDMDEADEGVVPVLRRGKVVGVVSVRSLRDLERTRADLGV